jgi:RNA polymerase sigma factor (sigma-70 family)
MLRDHGRAEDVVQDVFVSAMRAITGADAASQPVHVRAWLREIARRACIDQWRGTTRRGEVSLDAPDRLRAADAHRLADDDSLARATDGREAVATLRLAFDDLPELQHAVLVQRELEGRSIAEIADRLETTPTIVEGQLARGRRALGQAYKELESGQRCVTVRALCDVSVAGRLGVRDRPRIGRPALGCDGCRRSARAAGVDSRLIDRGVLQRASLLLPLPILRRLPMDHGVAGEAAGSVLGAKILVGAAVIAAGSGGVYARSVVAPATPSGGERSAAPAQRGSVSPFGLQSGAESGSVLRVPGFGGSVAPTPLPTLGGTRRGGVDPSPFLLSPRLTAPATSLTGSSTPAQVVGTEPSAPAVVAPAAPGSVVPTPALGTTPPRTPGRSVPLTPASPSHVSADDGPASPSDDSADSATGTSSTSSGDAPSDDAPMAAAAPLEAATATAADPTAPSGAAADAPEATPSPTTDAASEPASTPVPTDPDPAGSAPAASDEGAGVGD